MEVGEWQHEVRQGVRRMVVRREQGRKLYSLPITPLGGSRGRGVVVPEKRKRPCKAGMQITEKRKDGFNGRVTTPTAARREHGLPSPQA